MKDRKEKKKQLLAIKRNRASFTVAKEGRGLVVYGNSGVFLEFSTELYLAMKEGEGNDKL